MVSPEFRSSLMKSLIYSFLIFIINYVFFIFISTYVPTFDIKSEIFISALVAYGYLIVKLESRITIIKNIKYLIFSYLSLLVFVFTSLYLKYYIFKIFIFDIYFIFILLIFCFVPIVQYFNFPKNKIRGQYTNEKFRR